MRSRSSLRIPLAAICVLIALLGAAETVMLPMRDGVRLATDVYIPDGDAPWPVILTRTTYGRVPHLKDAEPLGERGYAFVAQDVRGLGGSEGVFNAFADDGWGERQDGADTVAWILDQPWCNGKIGTQGDSALGITQVLLAPATDGVACQSIGVAASRFYDHVSYQGGVFRKSLCEGWLRMFGEEGEATLALWKSHPTDDAFWSFYDAESRAAQVDAPGLHVGGWYDIFAEGTLNSFLTRQLDGGPGARGNQKLIMRPTGHGNFPPGCKFTLPENFDEVRVSHIRRRFQDYWLKGEQNGIMDEPAIWYYTIGDDRHPEGPGMEWRRAETWPPFAVRETDYYLGPEGSLGTNAPSFPAAAFRFASDPENPCPTVGGQNLLLPLGPFDQRDVGRRPDVLRFATAPLEHPVEATGPVRVRLFISSDAPDTDFTAKLVDVYPPDDGREVLVLDGVQRVKCRRGGSTTTPPLQPGDVVELRIDLRHTSWVFNRGHRIGLHVSGSNYPRFEKNPNNGEDFPGGDVPLRIAHNTVLTGRRYPSALLLPVPEPQAGSSGRSAPLPARE